MATLQSFLDALNTARQADPTVAAADVDDPATNANAPDLDKIQNASADRAEHAGDGPDVAPVFVPARPVIADTLPEARLPAATARPYTSPVPAASAAYTGRPDQAGNALPVQVVPPAGGRPRYVIIRNTSESVAVTLYTERSGGNGTTPPPGGYTLPAGAVLETTTQGPVFAASAGAWELAAWVDTYPAPTGDA